MNDSLAIQFESYSEILIKSQDQVEKEDGEIIDQVEKEDGEIIDQESTPNKQEIAPRKVHHLL